MLSLASKQTTSHAPASEHTRLLSCSIICHDAQPSLWRVQGYADAADGYADWPTCPPLAVEQSAEATGEIMPPITGANMSVIGASVAVSFTCGVPEGISHLLLHAHGQWHEGASFDLKVNASAIGERRRTTRAHACATGFWVIE